MGIALIREQAEKVKPPRALFVPFELGRPLGKPNNPELQHTVIRAALDLLQNESGPVLAEFPEVEGPVKLFQASEVQLDQAQADLDPAEELRVLRPCYLLWMDNHDGCTAVGISGIPHQRFRGMVRFLQAYARGEKADMKERTSHVSVEEFIRHCTSDLKAFCYESRMIQSPESTQEQIDQWFWGGTAAGRLLKSIAYRMSEEDDPILKDIAYGIAR